MQKGEPSKDPEMPADTIAAAARQIEYYRRTMTNVPKAVLRGCASNCTHLTEKNDGSPPTHIGQSRVNKIDSKMATDNLSTLLTPTGLDSAKNGNKSLMKAAAGTSKYSKKKKGSCETEQQGSSDTNTKVSAETTVNKTVVEEESEQPPTVRQRVSFNPVKQESEIESDTDGSRLHSVGSKQMKAEELVFINSYLDALRVLGFQNPGNAQNSLAAAKIAQEKADAFAMKTNPDNLSRERPQNQMIKQMQDRNKDVDSVKIKKHKGNAQKARKKGNESKEYSPSARPKKRRTGSTPLSPTTKRFSRESRCASSNPTGSVEKIPHKIIASSKKNQIKKKTSKRRKHTAA